jgi:hypothetical protein
MRVYIGGAEGQRPHVVARTLERALVTTVADDKPVGEQTEVPEAWSCAFVDGRPFDLLCLYSNPHTGASYYVLGYDVDEADADETP